MKCGCKNLNLLCFRHEDLSNTSGFSSHFLRPCCFKESQWDGGSHNQLKSPNAAAPRDGSARRWSAHLHVLLDLFALCVFVSESTPSCAPASLIGMSVLGRHELSLLPTRAWCGIRRRGISKGTTTRQRGQNRKRLTSLSTPPGEWDGSGGPLRCLIGFTQRCRYGKPRGEPPSDKPELHCGDKTASWSRWKMASRINGLGKMLTQSDASAAAENKVSGGIPAQTDGGG